MLGLGVWLVGCWVWLLFHIYYFNFCSFYLLGLGVGVYVNVAILHLVFDADTYTTLLKSYIHYYIIFYSLRSLIVCYVLNG